MFYRLKIILESCRDNKCEWQTISAIDFAVLDKIEDAMRQYDRTVEVAQDEPEKT